MLRKIKIGGAIAVAALLFVGCTTTAARFPVPQMKVSAAQVRGLPQVRAWGDEIPDNLSELAELKMEQMRASNPSLFRRGARPPLAYLALSGGGGNGAYGAGFLNGWSKTGTRPEFDIVTGVSTGALIAPFAFLGPDYDGQLEEIYTRYGTDDIVSATPLLSLIGIGAVSNNRKFASLIEKYVDDALLRAIAAEFNKGRRLLVGTTNLDVQRPVIWDMGKLAASGHPDALGLFRRIILASASIPAVFPPVLIDVSVEGKTYNEMHVDGGTTSQVFFLPTEIMLRPIDKKYGISPQRTLYIIWNGHLDPQWEAVEAGVVSVSARSINTLMKNQGIGDLARIYLAASRNNILYRLTSLPADFTDKATKPFEQKYMRKLYGVGLNLGSSNRNWVSAPPGF